MQVSLCLWRTLRECTRMSVPDHPPSARTHTFRQNGIVIELERIASPAELGTSWSQRVELQLNPHARIHWPPAWAPLAPVLEPAMEQWSTFCRESSDVRFLKKHLPLIHIISTCSFVLAVVLFVTGFAHNCRPLYMTGLPILICGFFVPFALGASKQWSSFKNIMREVIQLAETVGQIGEPYGFKVVPGGSRVAESTTKMTPAGWGLYLWLDLSLLTSRRIDIDKLPTISHHVVDDDSEEQPMCPICMCDFEENDLLRELPCSHRYHVLCIDQWLHGHDVCPLCKQDFRCTLDEVLTE